MPLPLMDTLQQHHSESWGWALSVCDWDKQMAEDVLQEAYLRVLDGRAQFGGRSSEKTWFFSVIRRVGSEQYRAGARTMRLARKWFAANDDIAPDTTFADAKENESTARFRQLLAALSQRQREVLHLVFYSGLTVEEAATTLGMSVGSARTHYHRGKAQLAEQLEQDDD
ncbi:MAG: RNA polymerase sigma factor [Halioglobus sp.]|nr:RNA polymerase sigma factor [Halioglobus sp.]